MVGFDIADPAVLGALEGLEVGDDSPAVLGDELVAVGKHGFGAVGDGFKNQQYRTVQKDGAGFIIDV